MALDDVATVDDLGGLVREQWPNLRLVDNTSLYHVTNNFHSPEDIFDYWNDLSSDAHNVDIRGLSTVGILANQAVTPPQYDQRLAKLAGEEILHGYVSDNDLATSRTHPSESIIRAELDFDAEPGMSKTTEWDRFNGEPRCVNSLNAGYKSR